MSHNDLAAMERLWIQYVSEVNRTSANQFIQQPDVNIYRFLTPEYTTKLRRAQKIAALRKTPFELPNVGLGGHAPCSMFDFTSNWLSPPVSRQDGYVVDYGDFPLDRNGKREEAGSSRGHVFFRPINGAWRIDETISTAQDEF